MTGCTVLSVTFVAWMIKFSPCDHFPFADVVNDLIWECSFLNLCRWCAPTPRAAQRPRELWSPICVPEAPTAALVSLRSTSAALPSPAWLFLAEMVSFATLVCTISCTRGCHASIPTTTLLSRWTLAPLLSGYLSLSSMKEGPETRPASPFAR